MSTIFRIVVSRDRLVGKQKPRGAADRRGWGEGSLVMALNSEHWSGVQYMEI